MMEKTWRWFGKKDKITLPMLRQIGVKGIVTALHDVPNGEIWTMEAINDLKSYIESYGLRWSVVESLPVCEAIKYAGAEREQLIENYKVSLANLGKCGIKTVCYNFMPVIDWIRTDLQHPWPDGTSSLYYDRIRFAYFDIRILEREGAEKDYTEEELQKVAELDKVITEAEKERLDAIRDAMKQNRKFPEKVIKYLWDDAFKFNREVVFETSQFQSLEQVIRTFMYAEKMDRFAMFKENVRAAFTNPEE